MYIISGSITYVSKVCRYPQIPPETARYRQRPPDTDRDHQIPFRDVSDQEFDLVPDSDVTAWMSEKVSDSVHDRV